MAEVEDRKVVGVVQAWDLSGLENGFAHHSAVRLPGSQAPGPDKPNEIKPSELGSANLLITP